MGFKNQSTPKTTAERAERDFHKLIAKGNNRFKQAALMNAFRSVLAEHYGAQFPDRQPITEENA